jgi:hypothetical protein
MDSHQRPSFVATFTRDFRDEDLDFAKSGLAELGFRRLRQLRSRPPKLTAKFADNASQERLDDVLAFLRTVPHCQVRLSYPGKYESP